MLIFVYGTLRRGASNHALLANAEFISTTRTQARYELVDMGGYPALLEGGRDAIVGELYEIDEVLTKALDEFEEVPELYRRSTIQLDPEAQRDRRDQLVPFADGYLMMPQISGGAPRIESGDWLDPTELSTVTVTV